MHCPKCDDDQPAAPACRSCGLLADRMADFARDRDAHVPPEVAAAWQRVGDHWSDDAAHEAFVRAVTAAMAYPWAALRYRDALRLRPDDAVAAAQLARLARMAEATLMASASRKPEAKARPYRAAVAMLIAILVLAVIAVAYAVVTTRQRGGSEVRAVPANPVRPATPAKRKHQPRPRAPAPTPVPSGAKIAAPTRSLAIRSGLVAQVDFAERQLTLKLVYYGPPLSGKTTQPARAARPGRHAQPRSADDARHPDDRTLFFDLLPIFFRVAASRSASRSTPCPVSPCTRGPAGSCSQAPTASCSSPTPAPTRWSPTATPGRA